MVVVVVIDLSECLSKDLIAARASRACGWPERVPTGTARRTFPVCRSDACLPKECFLTHYRNDGYGSSVVSSHPAGQLQRGTIESAPSFIEVFVRLANQVRR